MKKLISVIIVAIFLSACGSAPQGASEAQQPEAAANQEGRPAVVTRRNFSLEEQNQPVVQPGAAIQVGAQVGMRAPELDDQLNFLAGKPAVINFWATWCNPCRAEEGLFQQAYQKHNQQINFVGITSESGVKKKNEAGFIPIFEDTSSTVYKQYRVLGIPATFFVDKNGVIRQKIVGPLANSAELEKEISLILR
jgi:thiol-disulfide isomerase/thioredoxin